MTRVSHDPPPEGFDATVQARIDQMQAEIRDKIAADGWFAIHVFADGDKSPYSFTYSIGLWPAHPELIVVNLPARLATALIYEAQHRFASHGDRFEDGKVYAELIRDHDAAVEAVPEAAVAEHLRWAIDYHKGPATVTAVQIVWPDPEGHFPWEPGYDGDALPQPVFSRLESPDA